MKSVLNRSTLVLNKSFYAIGTTTVREAIILMSRESAKGLCPKTFLTYTWTDWSEETENPPQVDNYVMTSSGKIPAPEVIVLSKYDEVYRRNVRFTTKALYRRDGFTCQYCDKKFAEGDLSVDHVVPRAQGGKTSWENCVTACMGCNNRKADKSLKEAGLTLKRKPVRPKWNPIIHVREENRPESWKSLVQPEWWHSTSEA